MRMRYFHFLPTFVLITFATIVYPSPEDSAEVDFADGETSYPTLRMDLEMGVCEAFIRGMKNHLRRSLKRQDPGLGVGPFEVFVNALKTMMPTQIETVDEHNFVIPTAKAINVFEIKVVASGEKNPTYQSKDKCLQNHLHQQKDVVCWGVTLSTASERPDKVIVEWKAERYSQDGTFLRSTTLIDYKIQNLTTVEDGINADSSDDRSE